MLHMSQIQRHFAALTLLWRSYRNQSIDLQSKSMDWLLYGRDLHRERVNVISSWLKHQNLKPPRSFYTCKIYKLWQCSTACFKLLIQSLLMDLFEFFVIIMSVIFSVLSRKTHCWYWQKQCNIFLIHYLLP